MSIIITNNRSNKNYKNINIISIIITNNSGKNNGMDISRNNNSKRSNTSGTGSNIGGSGSNISDSGSNIRGSGSIESGNIGNGRNKAVVAEVATVTATATTKRL
jgi:hypothetical protein